MAESLFTDLAPCCQLQGGRTPARFQGLVPLLIWGLALPTPLTHCSRAPSSLMRYSLFCAVQKREYFCVHKNVHAFFPLHLSCCTLTIWLYIISKWWVSQVQKLSFCLWILSIWHINKNPRNSCWIYVWLFWGSLTHKAAHSI